MKSYMEQAENAGLSEGDYLKVCDALKQSFEKVNVKSNIKKVNSINFTLSFTDLFKNQLSLSVKKVIQMSGDESDKVIYTLVTINEKGDIIMNEQDETCDMRSMGMKLKNICATYRFDTFQIINDIAEIEYDVEKICKIQHARYKFRNELGPVDDDEDFDYYITPNMIYYEFILGLYHVAIDCSN